MRVRFFWTKSYFLCVQAKEEQERQRLLLTILEEESDKRQAQLELEGQERKIQREAWDKERLGLAAQLLKEKQVKLI